MKKLILKKLSTLNDYELRKISGGLILSDYSAADGGADLNKKKNCTCDGKGLNNNQATGCYCSDSGC